MAHAPNWDRPLPNTALWASAEALVAAVSLDSGIQKRLWESGDNCSLTMSREGSQPLRHFIWTTRHQGSLENF